VPTSLTVFFFEVVELFSVEAEERRQEARGKKRRKRKRRSQAGRTTSAEKIAQAVRTEKVFPAGVLKKGLPTVAHAARMAAGERPSGAGRL
jgi:hypothetical protein